MSDQLSHRSSRKATASGRRCRQLMLLVMTVACAALIAQAQPAASQPSIAKSKYEAFAVVKWGIVGAGGGNAEFDRRVLQASKLLSLDPDIVLLAARNPELHDVMPWLRTLDLEKPADQRRVLERFSGCVSGELDNKAAVVEIHAEADDGPTAAAIANAFAQALVDYCTTRCAAVDKEMRDALYQQCMLVQGESRELTLKRDKLVIDNNLLVRKDQQQTAKAIAETEQRLRQAEIMVRQLRGTIELMKKAEPPSLKLDRLKVIEEEKAKDADLHTLRERLRETQEALAEKLAEGLGGEHPQILLLRRNVAALERVIDEREAMIAAAVDERIRKLQELAGDTQSIQEKLDDEEKLVEQLKASLERVNAEERQFAGVRLAVEQLDTRIGELKQQYADAWQNYQQFLRKSLERDKLMISVAFRAQVYAPKGAP